LKSHNFSQVYKIGQLPFGDEGLLSESGRDTLEQIHIKVNALRRIKDEHEIQMILQIADMANAGYKKIKSFIRPGVTEREIQIEYEAEVYRHGAQTMPYGTIVGSGINSAVLHAVPTAKKVEQGDMVLIDAGADVFDYCVDITRVLPASGQFSPMQKSLYDIVKKAQDKVFEKSRIGTQWHDVHIASARVIAEGLKSLNIITGEIDSVLETGAISVFYPHGVGHLVGLRVRDVGCPENKNPKKYCGANLRVDLELKENFLITAEPGCYFIKALIDDAENRTNFKDFINWTEVEKWKGIGGVRIEDDILITQGAPRNLTAVVEKI
jgi:Xaa-Pro aminopeptidase